MNADDPLFPSSGETVPDEDYENFKREFYKLSGIDLSLYKEKQMKRRICTLIERKNFRGYEDYIDRLKADADEYALFLDYITINVTEFFRTPAHWEFVEKEILPGLLEHCNGILKIWSCACASGEEAYSLAISLCRLADPSHFHILATDIDEKVLRSAETGIYSEKAVENLPQEVLDRFFTACPGGYRVSDELRSCIDFRQFDMLKDEYPSDCDLIVCRNVLIYFTEEAKEHIYRQFKENLKHGGCLFTGNTEQIVYYKNFGLKKIKTFLYLNE